MLSGRWIDAFRSSPHLADWAAIFLARVGLLRSDAGTELMLLTVGTNLRAVDQFRHLGAWLQIAVTHGPNTPTVANARALLDKLASAGNGDALAVQAQLEA